MSNSNLNNLLLSQKNLAAVEEFLPEQLRHASTVQIILLALIEDLSPDESPTSLNHLINNCDITSRPTISEDTLLTGKITAKQNGVVAGLPLAEAVFRLVEPEIKFIAHKSDGDQIKKGQLAAEIHGPGRGVLTAERTALNFFGRLSGIATLTASFVQKIAGTGAIVLDTRKTLPGFRRLDKYAVRMGGGQNHRMGLYDMVMIKDNHIDGAGGIENAVERVRQQFGGKYPIEVEVKNLDELETVLDLDIDRIMLDNMDLQTMQQAVERTGGKTPLEASGNVSLERIRAIAETGVTYISIGALTHSVPVFDYSMRLK
ncbi:MAG: carboxylating nicotinate-nucleotide diphosphorylase [Chloroflexota bacterium]